MAKRSADWNEGLAKDLRNRSLRESFCWRRWKREWQWNVRWAR